jgi:D-alanine-D-alanine ligase
MEAVGMEALAPAGVPEATEILPRRRSRTGQLQHQIEWLASRMRIGVVFGGDKTVAGAVIHRTFNPRPWKSYESVAEDIAAALRRLGFQHVWCLPEDMRLAGRLRRLGIHLAWLNSGGVQGLGAVSHAPAMLEMLGVPYVGHDPINAGILDNKHLFKRALVAIGAPTTPFTVWHMAKGPFRPERNPGFAEAFGDHPGPFVVKPVSGRASHHVRMVERRSGLRDVVDDVGQATENHVLIETYLPGREYCIAACGPVVAKSGRLVRRNKAFTFAPIERLLAPTERIFTSMDVRPITGDRLRVLDAAEDAAELAELQAIAHRVFGDLDLDSLIRLDVRADSAGRMHVLEANPKPDLTAPRPGLTSLIARGLTANAMTYDDLILSLLADRIDLLFSQRRGTVSHIRALLD